MIPQTTPGEYLKPVQSHASPFKQQQNHFKLTMHYDTEYLQRCRALIEEKLGWPPAGEWRDFEFTELSEKIFDSTAVQLSTTTLKRVFGKVRYESLPSSATLNTLARYIGYDTWMDFKAAAGTDMTKKAARNDIPGTGKTGGFLNRKAVFGTLAALALVLVCGFVFLSGPSSSSASVRDVVFRSRPLSGGLPNSVVFNIDLKDSRSDDIVIQQSWDSTRTVRLRKGQKEATAIYYIPGYFRAKLIVDKKIVKEHDLYIRSGGWMATIDNNPDPPTYLKPEELVLDRGMNVTATVMDKVKKIERPTTLTYHLVQPFDRLHSDNFSFETAFQNTYGDGPAVCKTAKLFILCSNGAFIIPFTLPGCASDINLKLGEITWPGRSNDLSAFGVDPGQKIRLKLNVKNRQVSIFCNGALLREAAYHQNAGDIVGIRYSFLGAGSVDYLKFIKENGEVAYENYFGKRRDR